MAEEARGERLKDFSAGSAASAAMLATTVYRWRRGMAEALVEVNKGWSKCRAHAQPRPREVGAVCILPITIHRLRTEQMVG